ncbi:hypothetical protein BX070DRAFT_20497 [Coemansia spiralis]|nr:hypothetical protein BX070DRAFT_20497 [Coemansia spiralis]
MVVSHFFSPLRTLKKKTRGRSGTDSKRTASSSSSSGHDAIDSGSWSDGIDGDDSVAPIGGVSVQSKKNMATGLCLCCGSKVTFPDTVACFKCTVCDTINDLRPLVRMEKVVDDGHVVSKARTPPPPLTLERLKAGVQAYRRHPEKQSLLEAMIRESFANWDVLNLSFPNGKEVSSDEPGIQLDEVRAAYKIILSLPTPFIRAMMNGIEQIMRRPGRPLDQKSDIRYLLIIIEVCCTIQKRKLICATLYNGCF